MSVKPIPEGYHTVTPYLVVDGAERVLEFIRRTFQTQERYSMPSEDGKIRHAEIQIGDSVVMLSDPTEQWPAMPSTLHVYLEDCDAAYRRALEAGGVSVREPEDQFYGDRSAGVRDPGGNIWWVSTHVEDVSPEQLAERMQAMG